MQSSKRKRVLFVHRFTIENDSRTKITVEQNSESEFEPVVILPGEIKKISLPDGGDKILYIKRYDETTSKVCLRNCPKYDSVNHREIGPAVYISFDCKIDVSDFYATLVISEIICSWLDFRICSVFTTKPDRIVKYEYQSKWDRIKPKIILWPNLLLYVLFCFAMLIGGVVCLFASEYWIGIISVIVGIVSSVLTHGLIKQEKKFNRAELKDLLADANFIVIRSMTKHKITYDHIR